MNKRRRWKAKARRRDAKLWGRNGRFRLMVNAIFKEIYTPIIVEALNRPNLLVTVLETYDD